MSTVPRLILLSAGLWYQDQEVDVFAPNAASQLRQLLGQPALVYPIEGVGRTAELFAQGLILLKEDTEDRLLSVFVTFDGREGSPYSAFGVVPVFRGAVECGGHSFSGEQTEDEARRCPELQGPPGAPSMDIGRLHVGLLFKKRNSPLGTPYGEGRLVQLSAEWGGIRGFAPQSK